ncbi:ABC transporter ATP-binding protein [Leptotrichia sp. oral taxon 847]|uniref:ABC transporter ATP-binding protein n=1 Tax=Leptotrichia sp. oral taxon 847 TaxID=1785996 RepID=UPI0007683215|nr:ABC transporter ATP-binding protein [Leptotrichia sp. oral taxon 847]AMD95354.1 ABC transporter [Leptotrichia sp. oral taxon 847]
MEKILECKNLRKSYKENVALNSINLSVNKNKIIGLLGPNGSGKTTFIKLAMGLLKPTSGEMLIDGLPIGVETKKIISYLPDRDYLDKNQNIDSLIQLFVDFYPDFNEATAKEMLKDLKIDTTAKFKALSKGNREKVQLILAMSREAKLYLLDEPIAGVDPVTRDYILNTIIKTYNKNATLIISTHLINDVEKILDEVIFVNNGDILLYDSIENIKKAHNVSIDEYFREVFK